MLKGILFCACFLFAQLFLLFHIDQRHGHNESVWRQVAMAQNVQRPRETDEENQT